MISGRQQRGSGLGAAVQPVEEAGAEGKAAAAGKGVAMARSEAEADERTEVETEAEVGEAAGGGSVGAFKISESEARKML